MKTVSDGGGWEVLPYRVDTPENNNHLFRAIKLSMYNYWLHHIRYIEKYHSIYET